MYLNIPLPSPGLQSGEPAAVVLLPGELPGTVVDGAQPGLSAGAAQVTENTNTYQHISTHIHMYQFISIHFNTVTYQEGLGPV